MNKIKKTNQGKILRKLRRTARKNALLDLKDYCITLQNMESYSLAYLNRKGK